MEQFHFQLDLSILLWDQLLNSELYKDLCKVIIEFTVADTLRAVCFPWS